MYEINVGLARKGKPNLTLQQALRPFPAHGFILTEARIEQSGTEPTLVARLQPPTREFDMERALLEVSRVLEQDCIALYLPHKLGGYGWLVGDRAEGWGPFNLAFFIRS
jgi:hypothetical protein